MKYFLTGGTGFVGGVLARLLREDGHQVNAVVRTPATAQDLRSLGAQIFEGDITDKDSLREAMAGCDGVFHLAGWYKIGVRDKSPAQRINVDGTRNVLELMQELEIPKGVYTSTLAVNSDTKGKVVDETYHFEGQHISEYDRTKAEAHQLAEKMIAEGLPLVIVMPGVIYGPGGTSLSDESFRLYLQGKLPLLPRKTAYCWAHVEDIAGAHLLAMEQAQPGSTYIISGPCHEATEVFQIAEEITGIPSPPAVPPFLLQVSSLFTGLLERIIPLPPLYSGEAMRVQAGVTYLGDNSKAMNELGYSPRPLREGLRQTLEYEQARLDQG
jgi:nucleoside-diphosphate-sugar epimerase